MCKILTDEETRKTAWVRGNHPPSSGVCGTVRNQVRPEHRVRTGQRGARDEEWARPGGVDP